jgi:coproporphyrinogen III oxidase
MPSREEIKAAFQAIQDSICKAIEETDGSAVFHEDAWQHHSGGGGRTRLIQNGNILEKGGVNFSAVQGPTSEDLMRQLKLSEPATFFATGVSIVMHPKNPWVPIIHMNIRYFEMSTGKWWFGGGIDLTPHYVIKEDASWFHTQLKETCEQHDSSFYPKFKNWADDYFYIKHRQETRGIGGIFFDYLNTENYQKPKEALFDFTSAVGAGFAPIYTNLMLKNYQRPFTEEHKKWQMLRRGRYVEFNLVWDRGTKFGLETGGRTESILMSLPPVAHWEYNFNPLENSLETETLGLLIKGQDWI